MRILIGTLYTIENEFEECVAAIERQSHRNFQHVLFENLPKKEAHSALYQTFMAQANEFDLFIKVDADMVIEDKQLFAKIVNKFKFNNWLDELEIAVYDFFSDQLIRGMPVYRNSVKWYQSEEKLFTDLSPVPQHKRLYDDSELAPAAIHCKNPSPFQSFHYGLHRGLKIIQLNQTTNIRSPVLHWNHIQRTWWNFLKRRDIRLGFAVLGAELVFGGNFETEHLNYTNPFVQNVFKRYESYDATQVEAKIRQLRRSNWGFLPGALRRAVLFYLKGGHTLRTSTKRTVVDGIYAVLPNKWLKKVRRYLSKGSGESKVV